MAYSLTLRTSRRNCDVSPNLSLQRLSRRRRDGPGTPLVWSFAGISGTPLGLAPNMTSAGFIRRLGAGRPVNCPYDRGDLTGIVSAWRYNDVFILTWEECKVGDVHNEHRYTRDERHTFATPADVLDFITHNGLSAIDFHP